MFVRFFIDRPIFASVLSIVVTLAGLLAAPTLPLSQYPPVTPPTIQVDCNYPGASAKVVSETIASPVEQQVNGVERMLYMTSQCTSDGSYTLTVTFEIGTNLNLAQILVQNRVNLALPNLPDVVRATGVTTRKRSPEILMTVSLNSPDDSYSQLYMSNYAVTRVKDELSRVPGISDVTVFGQRDYAMRIWVNPEKLASRNLSANDVVNALREQNAQIAAGQVGQPPVGDGQQLQITLTALGRLSTVEEFGDVVVKVGQDGQVVRIRDVASVELGAKVQDVSNKFDNKQTVGLAIFLLTGANALEVGDSVKEAMERASLAFPAGVQYEIGYDTTPFIKESIWEVFKSLRDAILLVAIVVLVFLQSWRAAIIPLAAVPVAIIGTFGVMSVIGYSLNNLTLFGLVLAVGIVVDDAIVVVEAVQHQVEKGLAPRDATIAAMHEVTGPVFAVGVVLVAVFVPCAFIEGIIGQFFRQFAVTIAVSTLISTFNSLTFSPALAALLIRPTKGRQDLFTRFLNLLLGWFFWLFNKCFGGLGYVYVKSVGIAIRVPLLALAGYVGLLSAGVWGYQKLPIGFIPQQDKGYLIASIQLPDSASSERTGEAIRKISDIALKTPGIKHVNSVSGNSFVLSAYGSNFGSMFIILDSFENRQTPELYSEAIIGKLRGAVAKAVPEAQVNIFGAPAVSGLGRAGGFRIMIEDKEDVGPRMLQGQTENFIEKANQQPGLVGLFTVYRTNSPQIFLDVDRTACLSHGVELKDVFGLLQATIGARYVNDFNLLGRTWQVNVQAEQQYRNELDDIRKLKIRNHLGQMVPLGALLKVREESGPLVITRHNMHPSATVNGNLAPAVSSGDAMGVMERLAETELPKGMGYEWSELFFIERRVRDTGTIIFAISVAFVFLVLAALYESWTLPLAVILVVPVCVVGSLAAVAYSGKDVNVFTQVGFVVLIGLACKNAILIVEYAKVARDRGMDRRTAILEACHLRFRPILMTSLAFILGVVPLMLATGAGAEMRQALGTAVFGGMLGVTIFGIVLTPVFFVVIDWISEAKIFNHHRLQAVSHFFMGIITLRFVKPIASRASKSIGSVFRSRGVGS
ncbi:efflux RND transporter permease subunit [Zavarzinella formosa]|uniref:efflux RND transporter permease subunit n=1 Tax=Zavarzinella formosa TaxID=360055 RepID=UPI00030EEC58|nr:multidrug efflux RND transporter permease subunit [Zavarzinella formosa]